MQDLEVVHNPVRSHVHHGFQDIPYDVLILLAEFASVREVLLLGTLNRFFYKFTTSENLALWMHFTKRVYLLYPSGIKHILFNEAIFRMYTVVNSIPACFVARSIDENMAETNDNSPLTSSLEPLNNIISKRELLQWVADRCEEVIQDLRIFADIIQEREPRLALSGLLIALQAVKKRMWYTEVMDLETVRDLLRATVVEEEHDQGWSVLRTIAGRGQSIPRRFLLSRSLRIQSADLTALGAERRMLKQRWKRASAIAREYLQLREVLQVILAVSEVSDHPRAQQQYDSVWSALRGTSAMLDAERQLQQSQSDNLDEAGAFIPISATGDELLQQIRDLSRVTVGGIVSYFFGYVSGKVQRKAFLSALFSMKHLAGAERYERVPFW